jgi:hypothetical protein
VVRRAQERSGARRVALLATIAEPYPRAVTAARGRTQPFPTSALAALVVAPAVLAVVFALQLPALVAAWPFDGTTPMSFILMASMLAAAAASTAVPVLLRRYGALAGVGLDVASTFLPIGVFSVVLGIFAADADHSLLAVIAASALFGGWVMYRRSQQIPSVDNRPIPRAVRLAFTVWVTALVVVGGLLVARFENILPWAVTPDLSTFFGFMYLGAASYFWYGLRQPTWDNAIGQLAGFLAYDLVLVVPLLERLPTIDPAFATSLWMYLAVVVSSGVLAVWYLLLSPTWRLIRGRAGAVPGVTTSA